MTSLRHALRAFETPTLKESLGHAAIAFVLFGFSMGGSIWAIQQPGIDSIFLGVVLAILSGMILLRVFVIQHDCGHGSFSSSKKLNAWVGRACSLFTITPYQAWSMAHNTHHANFGKLEQDWVGEVVLLTDKTYLSLSPLKRWQYRFYRHPLTLVLLAPYYLFLVGQRFASQAYTQARRSALLSNVALFVFYGVLVFLLPVSALVMIFICWYVAGLGAILLFYIQHNFPASQYHHTASWNFEQACSESCSYLVLPAWLNWFTGNIAYHHIHHFSSKIPFYRLPDAQAAVGHLIPATQLGMGDILPALKLALWSDKQQRIIPFSAMVLAD